MTANRLHRLAWASLMAATGLGLELGAWLPRPAATLAGGMCVAPLGVLALVAALRGRRAGRA